MGLFSKRIEKQIESYQLVLIGFNLFFYAL